ncbi:BamA/TamA family outer membrane protein [Aquimarina brevivitae]|uniref:Outer membrane translocation and assembly module TamA n=1 Tax=Aquimarina brevivitae TaxID=323412 RepID=A0A4Q7NY02_9FLAO|nr:BamA/TamA family outer membrane protein [Aquimarina brevivitae]RZS92301.1 outer membrane translocation and assembly module TamA [Aquimarina brevivitae]
MKIKLVIGTLLLIGCSCSVEKYIPQHKTLYTGSELSLQSNDTVAELQEVERNLSNLLFKEPYAKFLGTKPGLFYHYKAKQEKPGFLNKFLNKKIGEEPIYLSDIDQSRTIDLIDNRLKNRGFFKNRISSTIVQSQKTAKIVYDVDVQTPYRMATYQIDTMPSMIKKDVATLMGDALIQKGDRFDLDLFKNERERIEEDLKNRGYYNFRPEFLIFEADTNQYKSKQFDLFLRLKRETPKKAIVPYQINEVLVYPNHSLDTIYTSNDTTLYKGVKYIQDTLFFKPKRLAPFILFEKGQYYNSDQSRLTSKRLSAIETYQFVNIRYDELDTISDGVTPKRMRARVYLSPLKKRAIRLELQAVSKSNNFAGPQLLVRLSNRNLFKGGESLDITSTLGYETQIASGDNAGLSSVQVGLGGDLTFPRILFPIKIDHDFKYKTPNTKISVSFEHLRRSQLYGLYSSTASYGYNWNANKFVYHEINPININYVNLSDTSEEFDDILEGNPFLNNSFQQQFIAGITYAFFYNELNSTSKRHPIFFNANVDIAGNTLSLFLNNSDSDSAANTIFGLEYAQYVKADVDFRYYRNLGNGQKLISRLFAGWGYAYGNSETMPYSKQYFSGGPYSVRAFRIRSLGPGTYTTAADDNSAFFDRNGDIRLEANLEYRFPIAGYFNGAVFADAGNVWLTEENASLPGGAFSSDFISELGVGAGVGLRVDIQNFVIRLDLAAPLNDPSKPKADRFKFDVANPVLNFGIGYPF